MFLPLLRAHREPTSWRCVAACSWLDDAVSDKRACAGDSTVDDRLLSVDEICAHLCVSRDTMYKCVDKTNIPAHRVGRLWKFKKDEVVDPVRTRRASGVGKTRQQEPSE